MLWGKADQANNAPKHQIVPNSTANGETLYANVTANAFVAGQKVAVLAVDATEIGVLPTKVLTFVVEDGGTGYVNGNILTVVGVSSNANATITTNSTGGITSLTLANTGNNVSIYANAAIANSTGGATGVGTGAVITYRYPEGKRAAHTGWAVRREGTGGRAGRVTYEVLVATNPSSDGSDDTILADS